MAADGFRSKIKNRKNGGADGGLATKRRMADDRFGGT
jgi:hypothetical protein